MEAATAAMSDLYPACESAAAMLYGSYKAYMGTTNAASPYPDYSKWFRISLTESKTAVSVFVLHDCRDVNRQRRIGNSYLCATETLADPVLA